MTNQPDNPELGDAQENASSKESGKEDTPVSLDRTISPSTSPLPKGRPRSFGDYELVEELARGGMGVVYRARQVSLDREVALKMILAGQFASKEDVERFHVEAIAAANLDHESIVPIYEIGDHDGHHYFSMKLIEGGHLGDRMDALRDDIRTGIDVMAKVCRAIEHAHRRGILHRDLKPANILLDNDNQPYVTDLGLARKVEGHKDLTRTGAIIGTPSYMAPEQAAGNDDVTVAADIYSLGALLYKLIAGRPPHDAKSAMETLVLVLNESPCKPSEYAKVDKYLEQICMKCIARDPSQRYKSAGALADDLEKWLRGEAISISAPSVTSVTKHWLKQNFGRVAWAFVIGPVLGIVSGLCVWHSIIHQNMSDVIETYRRLPSADRPNVWMQFDTPVWLSVSLMMVFAISIVLIGFVTVVYVRPKNRGADLAAGAIVGFVAALAGFMFCFAGLSILTTFESEYDNIITLVDAEPGVANQALTRYPELKGQMESEQVGLLLRREAHSRIFTVPRGIWLGAIASFVVYFIPSLFGAYAAGPLMRRHGSWTKALAPYVETAFPISILLTIFAVMFSSWLLFGTARILGGWTLILLLLMIVIAFLVQQKTWHWVVRFAVQVGVAVMFAFFVVNDFLYVPSISQNQARINRSQQRLAASPDVIENSVLLSEAYLQNAEDLANINRVDLAEENIDKALEVLENADADTEADQEIIRRNRGVAFLRKGNFLIQNQRLKKARELILNLAEEYPRIAERLTESLNEKRESSNVDD